MKKKIEVKKVEDEFNGFKEGIKRIIDYIGDDGIDMHVGYKNEGGGLLIKATFFIKNNKYSCCEYVDKRLIDDLRERVNIEFGKCVVNFSHMESGRYVYKDKYLLGGLVVEIILKNIENQDFNDRVNSGYYNGSGDEFKVELFRREVCSGMDLVKVEKAYEMACGRGDGYNEIRNNFVELLELIK